MGLDDTLSRLAELLDSHGGDSADWLRAQLALHATDATVCYAALNSKRMWGGAGVADTTSSRLERVRTADAGSSAAAADLR